MRDADVAIVGAGPAGIAAAVRASQSGARALVLDRGLAAGGQIWRQGPGTHIPALGRGWLRTLAASGASVVASASVTDIAIGRDGAFTLFFERNGDADRVTARAIVLATGARERFVPFPGWTLPGVVGIGGAQALLKSGASFAGKRVVIAGSGPLLLPVASSMTRAGARVMLVAEQARPAAAARFAAGLWRAPATLAQAMRYRAGFARTRYSLGTWTVAALGDDRVRAVTVSDGGRTRTIECDVLCTGYGLVPSTEAARLLGCAVEHGAVVVDEDQETTVANVYAAGEATGVGGAELAITEGEIAGGAARGRRGEGASLAGRRARGRHHARRLDEAFALRDELRAAATPESIVCRCEDIAVGEIRAHWTARQAKLYTRCGMGPCQARVCGPALEFLYGWAPDSVRAPLEPARVSTLIDSTT
ncbi:MAG: FAD-dependent oxidoreductase [Gemmatimonadaceae bacterium]